MRRPNAHIAIVLCALLVAFTLPALALAASGGGAIYSGGSADVQPAGSQVSSSSDGISITVTDAVLLAHQLVFNGTAPSSDAGQTVTIERSGHETRWAWAVTAQASIRSDGSFTATWDTNHIGRFTIRAVLTHPAGGTAASAWPTVTVTVYRPSIATQYGPGFWGRRTACGEVLRRQTIGVANRTLPCGTRVAIYYGGHTMVVPVIDRGPYANGADWDLTEATGRALGIAGTARIGAVSLPRSS